MRIWLFQKRTFQNLKKMALIFSIFLSHIHMYILHYIRDCSYVQQAHSMPLTQVLDMTPRSHQQIHSHNRHRWFCHPKGEPYYMVVWYHTTIHPYHNNPHTIR